MRLTPSQADYLGADETRLALLDRDEADAFEHLGADMEALKTWLWELRVDGKKIPHALTMQLINRQRIERDGLKQPHQQPRPEGVEGSKAEGNGSAAGAGEA